MAGQEPTPQTTLAIILGASERPKWPDLENKEAFKNSADRLKKYLLDGDKFGLPPDNLLDLFDSQDWPGQIIVDIAQFLEKRSAALKQAGSPARDVLVYFIGHAGFTDGENELYLTIWRSNPNRLGVSGIRIKELGSVLKNHAGN